MKRQRVPRKWTSSWMAIVGIMLTGFAATGYAIPGTLVKSFDGKRMSGDIRWKIASKEYVITADGVSMTLRPSQVKQVIVAKPVEFDRAVASLKAEDYTTALAAFEEIMQTYKMMDWDVKATAYAAEANLALGNATKAITLCEILIQDNPAAAYEGDIAEVYWKALVEADRDATLRKILDTAVKQGSRELASLAQVRRGDLDMKKGHFKEALVDGYLRTVVLYTDVDKHMPEALYKAAQCFEQLNETSNADKLRKKLLAEYPASPYAKRFSI